MNSDTSEFDDFLNGPDYVIGLSPKIRERFASQEVCRLVVRAVEGDPGDTDDIQTIMESISASMDDQPSIRLFKNEDPDVPGVIAMYRPADFKVLLMCEDETANDAVNEFADVFGFDTTAMRPKL